MSRTLIAGEVRCACIALALRHGRAPALGLGEFLDVLLAPARFAALEAPLRAALLAGLPDAFAALAPVHGAALLRALPSLSSPAGALTVWLALFSTHHAHLYLYILFLLCVGCDDSFVPHIGGTCLPPIL